MTEQRTGRFLDSDKGGSIVQGYRDATKDDPFNKKYLARNYKQYDYLKKQGLGDPKNMKKLKGKTDTELEKIATRAVMQGTKRKKLPTSYNKKKYNISWAKKVQRRKAAGQSVRKQALTKTRAARKHILTVNRNRRIMKSSMWGQMPKGFRK